jgi:hypothetical protein
MLRAAMLQAKNCNFQKYFCAKGKIKRLPEDPMERKIVTLQNAQNINESSHGDARDLL